MDISGTPGKRGSLDSGYSTPADTQEGQSGAAFNKKAEKEPGTRTEGVHDSHQNSSKDENPVSARQRSVEKMTEADAPGMDWPPETRELLKRGEDLSYDFNKLTGLMRDAVTDRRSDRGLSKLLVLLGFKAAVGQSQSLEQSRENLRQAFKSIKADEQWARVEQKGVEFLQGMAVDVANNGLSKEKLLKSDERYRAVQSEVMLISSKALSKKKTSLSRDEKKAVKLNKKLAAENGRLQSEYDDLVKKKLEGYKGTLDPLKSSLDELHEHHKEHFASCYKEARDYVLVPASNKKHETGKTMESEKVFEKLMLGTSSFHGMLVDFAKNYIDFKASGGRQRADADSADRTAGLEKIVRQQLLKAEKEGEQPDSDGASQDSDSPSSDQE